jgi:hypothetical protein
MLIDPGTYSYHAQKEWRDYFRGTAAHNTVRVDGLNQSVPGGSFLWLRHATAICLRFDIERECDVWEGMHDGYQRLTDPLIHYRSIVFQKTSNLIQVKDRLVCGNKHQVELFWHIAEKCSIEIDGNEVLIQNDGVVVRMVMPRSEWQPQCVVGQEKPPLGWVSRRFDEKTPAPCIVWSGEIMGSTELVTEIQVEFHRPMSPDKK